jgi:shikimate kinase
MTHPFNKIYLIGFMGSGKSTVGKKLALHLNWSFIDLDDKVELKAGMKIAEIFAEKGESFFRAMESKC